MFTDLFNFAAFLSAKDATKDNYLFLKIWSQQFQSENSYCFHSE